MIVYGILQNLSLINEMCIMQHFAMMNRKAMIESISIRLHIKRDDSLVRIGKDTIDEAPMVYKKMDSIIENLYPTAEIIKTIKPIYNFKAGQE